MRCSPEQLVGFKFYRRQAVINRVHPLEHWNPTWNGHSLRVRRLSWAWKPSFQPACYTSPLPSPKAVSSRDLSPTQRQQFPGSGFQAAPGEVAQRHLPACLEGKHLEMQFSQLHFFPRNYCNPCLKVLIRSSSSNEMPDLSAWIKHVSSLLYSKWKKHAPNLNKEG